MLGAAGLATRRRVDSGERLLERRELWAGHLLPPDEDVQVFDLPEAGGHGVARVSAHVPITPGGPRKFKGKS